MNRFNLSILTLSILAAGATLGLIWIANSLPNGTIPKVVYTMMPLFGALAVAPFAVRLLNKQYEIKKGDKK